jgi:ABC-type multidrug transport system fused ATPase/permease subunit
MYILKSKFESYIIPDIVSFIRNEIIINYLKTNEVNFNDKDVEKDNFKLVDFGFFFEKVFSWLIENLIPTTILIIFMNIYFLIKAPFIGVISLVCNILNYITIKSFFHKLINVIEQRQKSQEKMTAIIGENLNNLMDIHLNNKIEDTIEDTKHILVEYKTMVKNQMDIIMKFVNTLKIINYSFNLLNIYVLYKISKNVEDFFETFSMFILFIPIFENMTQQIPLKLGNLTDLLLLSDYFIKNSKIDPNINSSNNIITGKNINNIQNIQIENISFNYDSSSNISNIINDFSMTINKNDRIAILSQSGSGKTTLMKILLGFYKPQKGKIFINNININDINLKNLRNKINYVNQRTLLLNDTIINNMRYGNNKSDKEIIDILKKYDLLKIFKNTVNYKVDISGRNISFGMQKVIFLMRGILKDSEIYIFDEPLTSIDKETRNSVIKLIDDYTKNKTLLIITHDDEILSIVNKTFHI